MTKYQPYMTSLGLSVLGISESSWVCYGFTGNASQGSLVVGTDHSTLYQYLSQGQDKVKSHDG